jgi:hypothetical protein
MIELHGLTEPELRAAGEVLAVIPGVKIVRSSADQSES